MGILRANYQEMAGIAGSVTNLAEQYKTCVNEVYKVVESLENDWKGTDNVTYINQVKSYQEDLNSLGVVIENYAKFLSKTAQVIENTQAEIANNAGRL